MSDFLYAVHRIGALLDATGANRFLWPALFIGACILGIRHVHRHMKHGRVSIGGTHVGSQTGLDASGATLFRGERSVSRQRSKNPFWGRPAILRALPYPAAVVLLWLLIYAWWALAALTLVALAFGVWRAYVGIADFEHRRKVVDPLVEAISVATGDRFEDIKRGVVIPRDWRTNDKAECVYPLPGRQRAGHVADLVRLHHERSPGVEWAHKVSDQAPFKLYLWHKPAPPAYLTPQDVAQYVLANKQRGRFFAGLGSNGEPRYVDFNSDAPHIALSCGTQGGKSTFNRWLATQFAVQGAYQIGIDVKRTSFKGCDVIPNFHIYNNPKRLDIMWAAIHMVYLEYDRRSEEGTWEFPIFLYLEEQNVFADMVKMWWERIIKSPDGIDRLKELNPIVAQVLDDLGYVPKVCPLWTDVQNLLFMAGEFDIHLVSTYQKMMADAVGAAGGGQGGAMRDQYGVKFLARFSPSAWDSVVGTRPRPPKPSVRGRWILTDGSENILVQVPDFQPQSVEWLLSTAGVTPAPALSPSPSPALGAVLPPKVPAPRGDTGTGDSPRPAPESAPEPAPESLYDRVTRALPIQADPETADLGVQEKPEGPKRYTLKEACDAGIIDMGYEAAKRARTRSSNFPEGQREGSATRYTEDELRTWEEKYRTPLT